MNYSRQREAIVNVLKSTTSHPSAAWIYDRVRIQIPNISLGTVYRNLAALEKEGIIVKVPVGDNREHFDGDTTPHSHFYCKSCEAISDIPFDKCESGIFHERLNILYLSGRKVIQTSYSISHLQNRFTEV